EKLASVGLLAAGVAHEINNPLEIIFNHLNYLDMKSETSEQREVIGEIVEELRDIKSIVSNLISFSDSKKAALEEFDMNDLVSSLINLIRFNARSKNIDIIHRKNAENLLIRGSKNEMKQVLLNLLKNSFEAMPEGGTIKISTDCLAVPESPAGHVEVLIDDNGPGLSDDSGDIFLPFYTTKKGSENNLGLGLSVIYGIIKKYRGEIHASNRAEGGCRFRIRIPSSPG
ncbi:MAG: ATP-binding protein, partial [Spirochaetales bacterium]|nr:ATP-binding protein [Spirochaetales bacterium]